MNKLKLSLENFQSIAQGELEFCTGLNFIIGQSNSGKSATFRALKACLSNGSGSQRFIKKGTKQAVVTLEYRNNVITWKRTSKESSYIINGEDYVKTGNSNAFKILEDTGFTTDSNDTIMNIEEELQLPFPFGISKADLFKLYEDVFCVSDSAVILKSAKVHEEEVKDDMDTLSSEILKNKRKLEELNKFKEEVNIERLKLDKQRLTNYSLRLGKLKDGLDLIKRAVKASSINIEVSPISLEDKTQVYKDLKDIRNTFSQVSKLSRLSKQIKEISFVSNPKLNEYQGLLGLQSEIRKLNSLNELLLPEKTFENKLKEYNELVEYSKSLNELKDSLKSAKLRLAEAQSNLDRIEGQLKEYKVCPLCHNPLS